MSELTIRSLVDMAYQAAKADNWHNREGEMVAPGHPVARLAALADILREFRDAVDGIRLPNWVVVESSLEAIEEEAWQLVDGGLGNAAEQLIDRLGESGQPLDGSRVQVLAWLVLLVYEIAEAIIAVLSGNRKDFEEELADLAIRLGGLVGTINATADHPFGPIDLEKAIVAKSERNRQQD